MNAVRRIPLSMSGVALGFAALGNLLRTYGEGIRTVCGIVSALLVLAVVIRCIAAPDQLKKELADPVQCGIAGTFSMALLILSGYAAAVSPVFGMIVWWTGLALHAAIIVLFTARFLLHFNLKQVHASWYIVYIGIAAGCLTGPMFGYDSLAVGLFWFAFLSAIILIPTVLTRYVRLPVPAPARPLFCINTAPAALCLAAYLTCMDSVSTGLVSTLAALVTALYILVLIRLPKYLSGSFFPSWAAFTFPFVITAISLKITAAFLAKAGFGAGWQGTVVLILTVIAAGLVVYTLVRFIMFVLNGQKLVNTFRQPNAE